eukprot:m.282108 g.282108  ORF g.282108 m.282108 type:complete len:1634 (+) comp40651_c0_seq55:87-4988(+)
MLVCFQSRTSLWLYLSALYFTAVSFSAAEMIANFSLVLTSIDINMDEGLLSLTFQDPESLEPSTSASGPRCSAIVLHSQPSPGRDFLPVAHYSNDSSMISWVPPAYTVQCRLSSDELYNSLDAVKGRKNLAASKSNSFIEIKRGFDLRRSGEVEEFIQSSPYKQITNFTADSTPPFLRSFTNLDMANGTIELEFDEAVDIANFNSSKLKVFANGSLEADNITLTNANASYRGCTNRNVVIQLNRQDMIKIVATSTIAIDRQTSYVWLDQGAVTDMAGNSVSTTPILPLTGLFGKRRKANMKAFFVDMISNRVTLGFDDYVDAKTFNSTLLQIQSEKGSPSSLRLSPILARNVTNCTIIAEIPISDKLEMNRLGICNNVSTCYISFPESLILDSYGQPVNPVETSIRALYVAVDNTAPFVSSFFEFDLNAGTLTLAYSKWVLVDSFNPSAITLHASGSSTTGRQEKLTGALSLGEDGTEIKAKIADFFVTLLKQHSDICVSNSNCYLTVSSGLITDTSNTGNTPTVNPLKVVRFVPDVFSPEVKFFLLHLGTGYLTVQFTEPVRLSLLNVKAITVQEHRNRSEGNYHQLTTSYHSSYNGSLSVSVTLSFADINALRTNTDIATTVSNTFFSVESSAVVDMAFNRITGIPDDKAIMALAVFPDTRRPELKTFILDPSSSHLTIFFDEAMNISTLSLSNMTLFNDIAENASFYKLSGGKIVASSYLQTAITIELTSRDADNFKRNAYLGAKQNNISLSFPENTVSDMAGNGVISADRSPIYIIEKEENETTIELKSCCIGCKIFVISENANEKSSDCTSQDELSAADSNLFFVEFKEGPGVLLQHAERSEYFEALTNSAVNELAYMQKAFFFKSSVSVSGVAVWLFMQIDQTTKHGKILPEFLAAAMRRQFSEISVGLNRPFLADINVWQLDNCSLLTTAVNVGYFNLSDIVINLNITDTNSTSYCNTSHISSEGHLPSNLPDAVNTTCRRVNVNITETNSTSHCNTSQTSIEDILWSNLQHAINATSHGVDDKETVVMVGQLLENISKNLEDIVIKEKDLHSVVQLVSNTLQADSTIFIEAQKEQKSSSKIIAALEEITSAAVIADKRNISIVKSNLAIALFNPDFADRLSTLTFGYVQRNLSKKDTSFTKSDIFLLEGTSAVLPSYLGKATFLQFSQDFFSARQPERIHFFAFVNGKLFQDIDGDYKLAEYRKFNESGHSKDLNSYVIGARIGANNHTDLRLTPIKFQFILLNTSFTNATCSFWDLRLQNGFGAWSSKGCRLVNNSENGETLCNCNHLTNFGILTDLFIEEIGDGQHSKALSVISYIGVSLSIAGLLLTTIVHICMKSLRKERPGKILINLCVSMLFALLVFVINADNGLQNGKACAATAVLLHYFWLTTAFWMSVEAVNMYICLVKVFGAYVHRFVFKAGILAWGVPLVVVAATAIATKFKSYSKSENDKTCRMTGQAFYYSYYAILGAVLLFNLAVFLVLMIHFARKREMTRTQKRRKSGRARMGAAITVLLGLSWIFGMVSVNEDENLTGTIHLIFQYFFAITASSQGFLIFVFYCCLRVEVQREVKRVFCCRTKDALKNTRNVQLASPPAQKSLVFLNESSSPVKSSNIAEVFEKPKVFG